MAPSSVRHSTNSRYEDWHFETHGLICYIRYGTRVQKSNDRNGGVTVEFSPNCFTRGATLVVSRIEID
jgi:hypothetical protein